MATRIATVLCLFLLICSFFPGCDAPRNNPMENPIIVQPDNPTTIDSFKVKTVHTPYNQSPLIFDKIIAYADVYLVDPDGIKNVHIEISDTLRFEMTPDQEGYKYSFAFNPEDRGYDISDFIDSPIFVYIFDGSGFVKQSDGRTISRVLEVTPKAIYPKSTSSTDIDTTGTSPTLIWHEYISRFDIKYSINLFNEYAVVFTDDNVPRISVQQQTIPDTVDSLVLPIELERGVRYTWTVTVIDNLNNETVGERASFIVRNED